MRGKEAGMKNRKKNEGRKEKKKGREKDEGIKKVGELKLKKGKMKGRLEQGR